MERRIAMILLYTFLLLLLGAVSFLVGRRAGRLERKYAQLALATEKLLREPQPREGNSGKHDPCRSAKRQYQLGLLVQKRDRLEGKYESWQQLAEKLGRCVAGVRSWKGKTLPYALGVIDTALVAFVVDYLGGGDYVSASRLVQLATSVFAQ
jgi:hypothetical protein